MNFLLFLGRLSVSPLSRFLPSLRCSSKATTLISSVPFSVLGIPVSQRFPYVILFISDRFLDLKMDFSQICLHLSNSCEDSNYQRFQGLFLFSCTKNKNKMPAPGFSSSKSEKKIDPANQQRRDPYEVLGVSTYASDQEIKTAYRKMALKQVIFDFLITVSLISICCFVVIPLYIYLNVKVPFSRKDWFQFRFRFLFPLPAFVRTVSNILL